MPRSHFPRPAPRHVRRHAQAAGGRRHPGHGCPRGRPGSIPGIVAGILVAAGLSVLPGARPALAGSGFGMLPTPLPDAALAGIRGGFDLTPQVTVDFAYHQIVTANGTMIASVAIPQVQVALGQTGPVVTGAPQVLAMTPLPPMAGTAPAAASGPGLTAAPPAPTARAATVAPAVPAPTLLAAGVLARNGVGTVLTPQGLTTVIGNTHDNALIQNHTSIDIGLTGVPAMLTHTANAAMVVHDLTVPQRSY